jgi:hypothetical protein
MKRCDLQYFAWFGGVSHGCGGTHKTKSKKIYRPHLRNPRVSGILDKSSGIEDSKTKRTAGLAETKAILL